MSIKIIKPILNKIKPLDCIFFRGTDFISNSIVNIEKLVVGIGEWSHIGIVISRKIIPSLKVDDDDLYIWESTMSSKNKYILDNNTLDSESKSGVFGVQVRKLKTVILEDLKNGVKIGWGRLLNNPIDIIDTEDNSLYKYRMDILKSSLSSLHKQYYHKPYSKNIFRLCGSLYRCCYPCRSSMCVGGDWVFCSQFVTMVYNTIGVFKGVDSSTVLPQDIATPSISEENLPPVLDNIMELNSTLLQLLI